MGKIFRLVYFMLLCGCFASCKDKEICSEETDENDPNRITFVQISDPHVMPPELLIKKGKAFEEINFMEDKLLEESIDIFNEVLRITQEIRPQILFITGDMSKDGEEVAHQWMVNRLKRLQKEIEVKILVIPGNHDMNNINACEYDGDIAKDVKSTNEEEYRKLYNDFGYSDAVAIREGFLDYVSYPFDSLAIIALNSAEKNYREEGILKVEGRITEEQMQWCEEMVKKAHDDGRYVIVLMHHNPVEYHDGARLLRMMSLTNGTEFEFTNAMLVNRLANAGVEIVLSGHSHMQSITRGYGSSGKSIYSVVTSSLVQRPIAFRKGYLSSKGKFHITTLNLLNFELNGIRLEERADVYVWGKSRYFFSEFMDILCSLSGEKDSIKLQEMRKTIMPIMEKTLGDAMYTFIKLVGTGDEDKSLPAPAVNVAQVQESLDNFVYELKNQLKGSSLAFLVEIVKNAFSPLIIEIVNSAYCNYLTTPFGREVLSDSELSIQLHK